MLPIVVSTDGFACNMLEVSDYVKIPFILKVLLCCVFSFLANALGIFASLVEVFRTNASSFPPGVDTDELDSNVDDWEEETVEFFINEEIITIAEPE